MEQFLKALSSVLQYITPLKTLLLIVIIFASIGVLTVWENRQMLYSSTLGNAATVDTVSLKAISQRSKSQLDVIVQNRPWVINSTVLGIDVKLNIRSIIYNYYNDKEFEIKVRSIDAREGPDMPLFTNSEIQNKQVLSLLRGEFACSRVGLSGINTRYQNIPGNKEVMACRVPIPPAYGNLVGYIVFHLNKEPDEDELSQLRADSYSLSMVIYNEVLKTAGPVRQIY